MSLAWNGLITNKTEISGENKEEKIKVCVSVQILIKIMQCLWCAGHTEREGGEGEQGMKKYWH